MSILKKWQDNHEPISAGGAAIVGSLVNSVVSVTTPHTLLQQAIIVSIVTSFSYHAAKITFNRILRKSHKLRRLWLGEHDVEGKWAEVVCDKNGECISVGVTSIDASSFRWLFYGEKQFIRDISRNKSVFVGQQKNIGTFKSGITEYEWPTLHYTYTRPPSGLLEAERGAGILTFQPNAGKAPKTYTGQFTEEGTGKTFYVKAVRITDIDGLLTLTTAEEYNITLAKIVKRAFGINIKLI